MTIECPACGEEEMEVDSELWDVEQDITCPGCHTKFKFRLVSYIEEVEEKDGANE